MTAHDAIQLAISQTDGIVGMYLGDLSDAELLTRPVPGINHINWQLGHLIKSEHGMIEVIVPGSMPALPEGFAEKYTKDTAGSETAAAFCTKAELLEAMKAQRAGTLAALKKVPAADLTKAAPEAVRSYAPTVADVFVLQSTHWMMHAGQWAVTRRKLGRPALF
jgi:hypothetical protein